MTTAVEYIRRFRGLRVLVIGDAMLDTYYEGTAARLCSEGPVPVVRKTAEHHAPGGAANSAANLRALGAEVTFLSIIGDDYAGLVVRDTLQAQGIDLTALICDPTASTPHKMRILADGQYVVRFDDERAGYAPECVEQIKAYLDTLVPACDLIVISDYGYGVVSPAVIEHLRSLCMTTQKIIVVDSKDVLRFRDIGATVITPNLLEACLLVDQDRAANPRAFDADAPLADIEEIGRKILRKVATRSVAITLAARGVLLVSHDEPAVHLPAHPVAQANDVGAGDSFTAALGLALAAGALLAEAAQLGLDAAAIAVTKRWTAVVEQRELLQRVSLRDALPSDAQTTLDATIRAVKMARENGKTVIFTNGIFDILHVGHIRFLRQAKALGDVLIVGINSDHSVQQLHGHRRPFNHESDRLALVAALDPVDHTLLFDDAIPGELIRSLRPHLYVKGGDYADVALPEVDAVEEGGGRTVIIPLDGPESTNASLAQFLARALERDARSGDEPVPFVLDLPLPSHEMGAQQ